MDTIDKLLDQVEVLPLSPSLLPRLLPMLTDVDSNFDEIVDMVALDPSLTAKLLQICNSAFFGAPTHVSDVRVAINQIGYQSVYLLVAMINGGECFQLPVAACLDGKRLWEHSVTTAYGSKFVAESAGLEGSLLFTAGLLHDIGKVVLARMYGKDYALRRLRAGQTNTSPSETEIKSYGYSHAEVGACLLERWKLPDPLIAGVRFHHHPSGPGDSQRIAAGVCLGNILAHSREQPSAVNDPEFRSALALLNLADADVPRWQERLLEYRGLMELMTRLPEQPASSCTDPVCA